MIGCFERKAPFFGKQNAKSVPCNKTIGYLSNRET